MNANKVGLCCSRETIIEDREEEEERVSWEKEVRQGGEGERLNVEAKLDADKMVPRR